MKRRGITIWNLKDLAASVKANRTEVSKDTWVPARPIGFIGLWYKLKAIWMVVTNRADLVVWPGGQ